MPRAVAMARDSSMPRADSTSATTRVSPPRASKVSVTWLASSTLASMTPARFGAPRSCSTSSAQCLDPRSLMRTKAWPPAPSQLRQSARAPSLRLGSTASSTSRTTWSAREARAGSNSSVRVALTRSQVRAYFGSTMCARRSWAMSCLLGPAGGRGCPGGDARGAADAASSSDDRSAVVVGRSPDGRLTWGGVAEVTPGSGPGGRGGPSPPPASPAAHHAVGEGRVRCGRGGGAARRPGRRRPAARRWCAAHRPRRRPGPRPSAAPAGASGPGRGPRRGRRGRRGRAR